MLAQTSSLDQRDTASRAESATISGIVVGVDGRPVSNARVAIRSSESGRTRTVLSDDRGRFVFSGLAAGHLLLSATKAGYLESSFGQRHAGDAKPGAPIALSERQQPVNLTLTLVHGGAVEGTVRNDQGEAVVRTSVRAMRFVWRDGARALQTAGEATTDDRGRYRVFRLRPGQYVVMAVPPDTEADELAREIEARAAAAGQKAAFTNVSAEVLRQFMTRAGLGVPSLPGETIGYAPAFYPGTSLPSATSTVSLGIAQEISGLDIRLEPTRLIRVTGVVSGASMRPIGNADLFSISRDAPMLPVRRVRAGADGQFTFAGVPPGSYEIAARATEPDGSGSSSAARLWAQQAFTVAESVPPPIALVLQRSVSVSGRMSFENDGAASENGAPSTVALVPVQFETRDTPARANIQSSGRFSATNVVPGTYRVDIAGPLTRVAIKVHSAGRP